MRHCLAMIVFGYIYGGFGVCRFQSWSA